MISDILRKVQTCSCAVREWKQTESWVVLVCPDENITQDYCRVLLGFPGHFSGRSLRLDGVPGGVMVVCQDDTIAYLDKCQIFMVDHEEKTNLKMVKKEKEVP